MWNRMNIVAHQQTVRKHLGNPCAVIVIDVRFGDFIQFAKQCLLHHSCQLARHHHHQFLVLVIFTTLLLLGKSCLNRLNDLSSTNLFNLYLLINIIVFIHRKSYSTRQLSMRPFIIIAQSFDSLLHLHEVSVLHSTLDFCFNLLFLRLIKPHEPIGLICEDADQSRDDERNYVFKM